MMQINVRGIWGKTLTLEVSGEDTVQKLKQNIFEAEGIPIECMSLSLTGLYGPSLWNDKKLKEYPAVQNGCTIQLYLEGASVLVKNML